MARFRFDHERRLLWVVFEGPFKGSDVLRTIRELVRHPDFNTGARVLVDLRAIGDVELFGDDVRAAADLVARFADAFRGARVAIVAPLDAAFGVARQFELMNAEAPFDVRSFRALAAAEAWLADAP